MNISQKQNNCCELLSREVEGLSPVKPGNRQTN
jgi:hypothetical protein